MIASRFSLRVEFLDVSTFGQLRFLIQTQFPGVPIDIIDSAINSRYEQTLLATNWIGVKYHATIQTTAAYQSGQQGINPQPGLDAADLTVGSATVSIINTPGQLPIAGMRFYSPGDSVFYTIATVANPSVNGAMTAISIGAGGTKYVLNQILNLAAGSNAQVQITAVGPSGNATQAVIFAGGVGLTVANGIATSNGNGATITILSVGAGGAITGLVVDAGGGTPYIVGQVLNIVQAGGSNGTATVASVNEYGVVIGVTLGAPGLGYTPAPNLATTTSSGCTINVTAVSTISFTLDRPYEGNGVDAQGTGYLAYPYVYMQHIYELPDDVDTVISILDPITGFPLTAFTKDSLDQSVGPRTLVNDPQGFAVYDDTNEAAPPVLHQIEFYPPPLYARGFNVEYEHSATGFDGSTTNACPLPFVTDTVLLYGCRADAAMYLAGEAATPAQAAIYIKQAAGYETLHQSHLAKLVLQEHMRRRTKGRLQMDIRWTRHRLGRASRALNSTWRGGTLGGPT